MRFPVILDEERRVRDAVILVLPGSMIEGANRAEEVVRHGEASDIAAELGVSVSPDLVHEVNRLADHLAAELDIVASMHPTCAVAPLKAGARELRFQIVADVEEAHRLNLRDRGLARIERQPDPEIL